MINQRTLDTYVAVAMHESKRATELARAAQELLEDGNVGDAITFSQIARRQQLKAQHAYEALQNAIERGVKTSEQLASERS